MSTGSLFLGRRGRSPLWTTELLASRGLLFGLVGLFALINLPTWLVCAWVLAQSLLIGAEVLALPRLQPILASSTSGPWLDPLLDNLEALVWLGLAGLWWLSGDPALAALALLLAGVTITAAMREAAARNGLSRFLYAAPWSATFAFLIFAQDRAGLRTGPLILALAVTAMAAFLARRRRTRAILVKALTDETDYRELAQNATDMIVRYDTDELIQFASPSVRRLGYPPTALVGRPISDFVHPDDLAPARRRRAEIFSGRAGEDQDFRAIRVRTADGGWLWLQNSPRRSATPTAY